MVDANTRAIARAPSRAVSDPPGLTPIRPPPTRLIIRLAWCKSPGNAPHERPRQGRDRSFGLPARLPVDVRAGRRAAARRPDRPRARRGGQQLHGRRHLRQGRALRRARAPSRPAACTRCGARAPRARASSSASPGTTPSTSPPRPCSTAERRYGPEAVWPYYYAGTMGLVMRDGINRLRHAKRYSRHVRHHLHHAGLDRLHRRHRPAGRPRPARDGEVRHGGDLGHQPRQHAGQRDDARHPRAQGARRQDRGDRHLPQRHDAAGRHGAVRAARHRRGARLRRHARAVPRSATPTGRIWRSTPIARASSKRISRRARRSGPAPSPA